MQAINRFFYGPTPEERVRTWQSTLRAESRLLDKEMRQLDVEANKVRATTKQLATKGDVKSARILARELVRSNKAKDRLSVSKATLGSLGHRLTEQMAIAKVTGSLQKSTEIMKLSNALIKLPQVSQVMRDMRMDMTKAGVVEEMLDDVLGDADEDDLEEEADAEVDRVLFELTNGKLGQAGSVGVELPNDPGLRDVEIEKSMEEYRQQLDSLLST